MGCGGAGGLRYAWRSNSDDWRVIALVVFGFGLGEALA
jgi:hypothetical protein